jgi:serine/threonine-protein kinase
VTESAERWRRALAIVDQVLDLGASDRARAVAGAASGDADLEALVLRWLSAHDESTALDHWSAINATALAELSAPLPPGTMVGAWRLVGIAGSGGMGTVYEAERADGAFDLRAALKIVRHVGDVALLSERLRRERAILATLDHPHIARLLDGGITDTGLPWYVMEFVEGTPITGWCDAQRLDVPRRLRLFQQACDAVQYAHQRLVVHRDLKPGNMLVTAAGGLKLLDFGIATLLDDEAPGPDAPPRTLARLLTPEYASPEQRRGEPATAGADVYSLGVVLYELLVGKRPAGDDPPPPSAALSAPSARAVRGDLDSITLTALNPDAEHRYGSAEALGADIANHLAGRPVRARQGTWWYRTSKFVRRNRAGVLLGALALVAILGSATATMLQARRAEQEAAAAQRSSAFVVGLLELAYPYDSGRTTQSLRSMLDSGAARLLTRQQEGEAVDPDLLTALSLGFYGLGRYDRSVALDSQALAIRLAHREADTSIAAARWQLAESLRLAGRQREAALVYSQVLPVMVAKHGPEAPDIARLLQATARAHRSMNNLAVADSLLDRVFHVLGTHAGIGRIAMAHAWQTRGHIRLERGDLDGAAVAYANALEIRRDVKASPIEVANSSADLAGVARRQGDLALADSLITVSLEVKRRFLGDLHPEVADDMRELGAIALARGDIGAAERIYRDCLARYATAGEIPQWRGAPARVGLASALVRRGRTDEARGLLDSAIAELALLEVTPSTLQKEAVRLRTGLP